MIITTTKQMRPRDTDDHYPTDPDLVAGAYDLFPDDFTPQTIIDPGAGSGIWGVFARHKWGKGLSIKGVEIRTDVGPHRAYTGWFQGSFIQLSEPNLPARKSYRTNEAYDLAIERYNADLWAAKQPVYDGTPEHGTYDLVIGNPPYRYAEAFIRKALPLLQPNGYILFLLRLAFLESQTRASGLYAEAFPIEVHTCVHRPSFTGDGKTDATAYAIFIWSKADLRRSSYQGFLFDF